MIQASVRKIYPRLVCRVLSKFVVVSLGPTPLHLSTRMIRKDLILNESVTYGGNLETSSLCILNAKDVSELETNEKIYF